MLEQGQVDGSFRHFPARFAAFMRATMTNDPTPLFVPVGANPARPFGMDARDRACRLATNAGFECADAAEPGRAALLASLAYAWDPAWLKAMRSRPRTVLTLGGKPVMAHVPAGEDHSAALAAVERGDADRRATRRWPPKPPSSTTPSCASATARSSCRSTRTTPSRSSAPPMTRRTRASPTS